ncbi:hypothetical protein IC582_004593 [Cucumis melo]
MVCVSHIASETFRLPLSDSLHGFAVSVAALMSTLPVFIWTEKGLQWTEPTSIGASVEHDKGDWIPSLGNKVATPICHFPFSKLYAFRATT